MRRVLGLAIALVVVATLPVRADGADHSHAPVVLRVEPAVDGLEVDARAEPAPTLVLRNDTGEVVEIRPIIGHPFLRIGPEAVDANVRSPEFFRSESPSPLGIVPASADAGEPRWVTLVDGDEWAWFEHRIALAGFDEEWRIPITVGGDDAEIVGAWQPVEAPAEVIATIDPIDVDGLTVSILAGLQPGLYVDNATGETLVVDGPRGEPFLRIGPITTTRALPGADAEVVAPSATYAWIDPRVGWPDDPPSGAATKGWEIPARLGDRELVLTGSVEWRPVETPGDDPADGGVPWLGLVAVLAVALAATAWVARRDKSA